MRVRTGDGWLLIEGERAFKLKRHVTLKDAARETGSGALVGVLKWWEDDAFEWTGPPEASTKDVATLSLWLTDVARAAEASLGPVEWSVWVSPAGEHAVLLTLAE